ncbi:MAG: PEP-CTERM sorting domain-containing protein [Proteobacteria bacterium]|nr:PEP-CTERM sorting domain-containing protein [Pseudomonadota bacterium]
MKLRVLRWRARRRVVTSCAACVILLFGFSAQAAVVSGSTLVLDFGLTPPIGTGQSPDPAVISVVGDTQLGLPAGLFATTQALPASLFTGVPSISGFSAVVSNASGTFQAGAGPGGGFGGALQLNGYAAINILQLFPVTIPLNIVGAGGTVMWGAGAVSGTVTGSQWTTGNAVITGVTQATPGGGVVNTISLAGSNGRVGGVGPIALVTPVRVSTNVLGDFGGFAIMTFWTPEPGTALLMGCGVLGFALMGARKQGRKR